MSWRYAVGGIGRAGHASRLPLVLVASLNRARTHACTSGVKETLRACGNAALAGRAGVGIGADLFNPTADTIAR